MEVFYRDLLFSVLLQGREPLLLAIYRSGDLLQGRELLLLAIYRSGNLPRGKEPFLLVIYHSSDLLWGDLLQFAMIYCDLYGF